MKDSLITHMLCYETQADVIYKKETQIASRYRHDVLCSEVDMLNVLKISPE